MTIDQITNRIQPDAMLTTGEVAELLGIRPKTLRNWSFSDRGPKAVRLPNGSVRYLGASVIDWLGGCKLAAKA